MHLLLGCLVLLGVLIQDDRKAGITSEGDPTTIVAPVFGMMGLSILGNKNLVMCSNQT